MKKRSSLILSILVLSGCNVSTISSSHSMTSESKVSSSTVVNSMISNSSSSGVSSSSSAIDKTNWIAQGEESDAILNPNNWYYWVDQNLYGSTIEATNAMYLDEELYFNYKLVDGSNWSGAQLFYHDSSIEIGATYKVTFKISSSNNGIIVINGEEISLVEGTNDIEVERVLTKGAATVSIQFGSEEAGIISNEARFLIRELNIVLTDSLNPKRIIEKAIALDNYTIELIACDWGNRGIFKFFNQAVYYSNDGENRGYAENEKGVFEFMLENEVINPSIDYCRDSNGEILKGLYTLEEEIDTEGVKGLVSLHKVDLSIFDFEAEVGVKVNLDNPASLKIFSYLASGDLSNMFYGGVSVAEFTLLANDNFQLKLKNKVGSYCTYKIYNIGSTEEKLIDEFVNSNKFGPIYIDGDLSSDPEVKSILSLINENNYTIKKENGSYFYMNKNYSYNESVDEEGNVNVNGYLLKNGKIHKYSIYDNELTVQDTYDYIQSYDVSSIAELAGLTFNVDYFNLSNAIYYIYDETSNSYIYSPTGNNYDYYYYDSAWFGLGASSCEKIALQKLESNIVISSEFIVNGSQVSKEIVVSNIGNTKINVIENYLAA